MTFAVRSRGRRAGVIARCALLLAAAGLVETGCILFEDPAEIEGVDGVITPDTSEGDTDDSDTTADTVDPGDGDIDGDMGELCSPDNPLSCGAGCVDCTALSAVEAAACQSGACLITTCTSGFADCNGIVNDGCEQTETDRACGATCQDCTGRANTSAGTCTAGSCVLSCLAGSLDCDAQVTNGCEQAEDLAHCGASCLDCTSLPGVSGAQCSGGGCVIEACGWGALDCNGDAADGCEEPLDDTRCGPSCGDDCTALPGVAKGKCTGQACVIVACAPGYRNADNDVTTGCEDTCLLGECWTELPREFLLLAAEPGEAVALAGGPAGALYFTDDAGASWYPRTSPLTGTVRAIARDVNLAVAIAVGETNRLARSADQGLTWEAVLLPVSTGSGELHAVAVDGDTVVLGGDGRLLLSRDAGQSWENITTRVPPGTNVRALLLEGSLLMVASQSGEVFRSTDTGATFAEVGSPAPNMEIRFLVGDGTTIYAGGSGFAAQTTDRGLNWTPLAGLDTPLDWRALAASGGMVALVAGNQYALKRAGEDVFGYVTIAEPDPSVTETLTGVAIDGDEAVLIGHQSGFGHTFRTDATAPEGRDPYVRLELSHEDVVLDWVVEAESVLLSGGGAVPQLLRSGDDGLSWAGVEVPTTSTLTLPVLPTPDEGVIAGTAGKAIRTLNTDAQTWELVLPGLSTYDFRDIAFDPSTDIIVIAGVWSGTATIFVGQAQDTAAGDAAWNPVTCLLGSATCPLDRPAIYVRHVELAGSSAVVATDGAELLRADDLGAGSAGTWQPLPDVTGEPIEGLEYDGQRVVFFTTSGGISRIWYSADQGATWPWPTDPLVNGPVFEGLGDAAAEPPIPPVALRAWSWDGAVGVAVGDSSTLVRTTDNGASWTQLVPDLTTLPVVHLRHVVVSGDSIVAVGADASTGATTVLYSADGGASFGSVVLDLRGFAVGGLTLDAGRVLLVARHGQVLRSVGP